MYTLAARLMGSHGRTTHHWILVRCGFKRVWGYRREKSLEPGKTQTFFGQSRAFCNEVSQVISIGNRATSKIVQALSAPTGLNTNIAALSQAENVLLSPIPDQHFFTDNVAIDLAEKAGDAKYTAIYVYCDKITNSLKEKFRS